MPTSTRAWGLAVIALVILAFLRVTEPVTVGERPAADSLRKKEPAAIKVGPFAFYKPAVRLRLGLDLQGGSHVVLRARKQAIYTFRTARPLFADDAERAQLQNAVVEALPEDLVDQMKLDLGSRNPRTVVVRLTVDTDAEVTSRRAQLVDLLNKGPLGAYGLNPKVEVEKIKVDKSVLNQVRDIMEQRVNKLGVSEAAVQIQQPDRILVELPGMKDPQQVLDTLQTTAVLEFVHIDKKYQSNRQEIGGHVIYKDGNDNDITKKVLAAGKVIVDGSELKPNCKYEPDPKNGMPAVAFEFKPSGRDKFYEFTRKNTGEVLAIVLDGEVLSDPTIHEPIPGRGQISGGFESVAEAQRLADLLNAGSLPVPLEIAENRTVGATLGRDSLTASLYAGLLGLALVLVFMAVWYRLPGLLADVALLVYIVLLLGVLKAFDATLTLPGIAGIIISIGMAVDANVIIFERLKEELRAGKTLKSAIDAAFKRAFTAILDSNVCSIITALVLISLGTGAVKGFAITLLAGVVISLFTAITVTRLLMNVASTWRISKSLSMYGVKPAEIAGGPTAATGGQRA